MAFKMKGFPDRKARLEKRANKLDKKEEIARDAGDADKEAKLAFRGAMLSWKAGGKVGQKHKKSDYGI